MLPQSNESKHFVEPEPRTTCAPANPFICIYFQSFSGLRKTFPKCLPKYHLI